MSNPDNTIVKEIHKISKKKAKTDADRQQMSKLEWYGGLYLNDRQVIVPAYVIEAMITEAAKKTKEAQLVKRGLYVEGIFPLEYDGGRDIDELWKQPEYVLQTPVRIKRDRIWRTRPIFREWKLKFEVHYDPTVLNESQIADFMKGGTLGDWRPKYGRFEIVQ